MSRPKASDGGVRKSKEVRDGLGDTQYHGKRRNSREGKGSIREGKIADAHSDDKGRRNAVKNEEEEKRDAHRGWQQANVQHREGN